jgi:vancomycin permeability regulator SanA
MGNLTRIHRMMTILIFGAAVRPGGEPSTTLRRRVEAALACAKDDPDTRFIPTGGIGRHGPSEASVMARLLTESGVPGERILLEETGTDTLSSVRAIYRLAREQRVTGHVMVATSPFHLPRCLLLLCLCGIAAKPCGTAPEAGNRSWQRWYWRLREVPAIPYDAMLAVWHRIRGRL